METRGYATKQVDWLVGMALGLAALALYVFTLAPTVLQADAGEFQFVPWIPGIAHPTGYPLYVMLGWMWTHALPLATVAWRMNLLSAVLAALAVGVTYSAARQLLAVSFPQSPPAAQVSAAAVTGLTFAVTRTFWSQAIIAEVYALHALLVALIVALALKFGREKKGRTSRLLALSFGLGLTHHITTVLLLPALLLYLWLANRLAGPKTSNIEKARWLVGHGLLAALPLLLYLYLPLAAPGTPYATLHLSDSQTLVLYENSWRGFLQHITGTVFTGDLQPAAVGLGRFVLTGHLLWQQVDWIGIGLAAVGLLNLVQKRRWDVLALTGIAFVTIVAFNLVYFIGDVFVLFIPAWFFVCLWLGVGVLGLAQGLAHRFVRRKMGAPEKAAFGYLKDHLEQNMARLTTTGLTLFFFVLPIILLATHFSQVNQSSNTAASRRWQQILNEPIPESAVLLSNDRNEIMPMWYYQYVENRRPDLMGLFPLIVQKPAFATVGGVLDAALASGRPVFLTKPMDGLSLKAELVPTGSLVRAKPLTGAPTHLLSDQLLQSDTDRIKLVGYDVSPNSPTTAAPITITLYWQVIEPLSADYTSFVHILAAGGQRIAQNDHRPGGEFYPSHLWRPGELLRDRHNINLDQPGTYRLKVGMYVQSETGTLINLGDSLDIGVIRVK